MRLPLLLAAWGRNGEADAFFALGRLMEEYPMIVRNAAVVILLATAIIEYFGQPLSNPNRA